MNELTRVRFVIALRFTLETFLDGLLHLGQAFEVILQCLEALIGTATRSKFLESGSFQYIINRWAADVEVFCQLHYLSQPGLIKPPNFLTIQ